MLISGDYQLPRTHVRWSETLDLMNVGDSFEVALEDQNRVAAAASRRKTEGRRFSVRQMPGGTLRCFRVQ